jgi:hypothetical protein
MCIVGFSVFRQKKSSLRMNEPDQAKPLLPPAPTPSTALCDGTASARSDGMPPLQEDRTPTAQAERTSPITKDRTPPAPRDRSCMSLTLKATTTVKEGHVLDIQQ